MAAAIDGVLPGTLQEAVKKAKILVVGAGGIGCEVLKNLVLSGFTDIEIIDLDTIDLSNLNRQFLFHSEHVGKSKAKVARESALSFNPDAKIVAYHDSVTSTDYGVSFFKKFSVVLSALDNRAARNHVNRMCLNADVPLIESGTSGYNGQVELIKRGLTQCYECTPKAVQRSFAGCTIRNTPSEPIHCIVWAKHLFNQLFGESIEDEDISPDAADPDAKDAADNAEENTPMEEEASQPEEKTVTESETNGSVARINTRQWAKDCNYDAGKLFNKFFFDDINYLLRMANLWKERKAPVPQQWEPLLENGLAAGDKDFSKQYHKVWTLEECAQVFSSSLKELTESFLKLEGDDTLVWDKDDRPAMDFVAACANVRSHIFNIERKSRFEVKSMAGNIIPAIATTNAITAGISVMRALNALEANWHKCKAVYARLRQNARNQFLVPDTILALPNPNCYVCSLDPAITLKIDTKKMRVKDLRDEVLVKALNMVDPEVTIQTTGSIVISSDEDETEANNQKQLAEVNILEGVILTVDDFFQNYKLTIIINHVDAERDQPLFRVIADAQLLQPRAEKESSKEEPKEAPEEERKEAVKRPANGDAEDGPSTSKKSRPSTVEVDDDDDCLLIEEPAKAEKAADIPEIVVSNASPKTATKRKPSVEVIDDDDDVTEVPNSSEEAVAGPTKSKRSRLEDSVSQAVEVIHID
ncbi:hypothetical protein KR018_002130 [Drosophila ironensis]|nr:hypothetical protein KR018_002130 [Drosophila ironensis]